jgi:hypothetical protein
MGRPHGLALPPLQPSLQISNIEKESKPSVIAATPINRPVRSIQVGSASHFLITSSPAQATATVPPTAKEAGGGAGGLRVVPGHRAFETRVLELERHRLDPRFEIET